MLLTETIERSTSAIQLKRATQESHQSAENYVKALGQLAQTSEDLKIALSCAAEMKSKGLVDRPLLTQQMCDSLKDSINICGKGVYEGTLTIDMVKALNAQEESFAKQIQNDWKEASIQYSEGTKGYLSLIGGLSDDPKHAKELTDYIAKTVNGPLSIAAINRLLTDIAEAKRITGAFAINPNVETFLKKVSAQQATVSDLTPDILAWLGEKNLMFKLKVKF